MQLQDIRDEPVRTIPMGMQKRVELARSACGGAELSHSGRADGRHESGREGIYRPLHSRRARDERGVTVFLIEHHMDVVTAICDHVMVLSYGETIAEGEPARRSHPRVVQAYLGERAAAPISVSGMNAHSPARRTASDEQPATLVAALAPQCARGWLACGIPRTRAWYLA